MENRRAWRGIATAASGRRPDGRSPPVERGDNGVMVGNRLQGLTNELNQRDLIQSLVVLFQNTQVPGL
jgi:hypothetical protein